MDNDKDEGEISLQEIASVEEERELAADLSEDAVLDRGALERLEKVDDTMSAGEKQELRRIAGGTDLWNKKWALEAWRRCTADEQQLVCVKSRITGSYAILRPSNQPIAKERLQQIHRRATSLLRRMILDNRTDWEEADNTDA